ncbi:hypothetical protein [Streptomyces sp. NBC_01314]|uniref:hypothetical protein n=1 Tax=Streptomyces sp. NBC_01314 TaxID=2903821 RepID=UPI00308703C3|nr:hypothetical protein OG622_33950 [Streptomyces sp. NBC_01314]
MREIVQGLGVDAVEMQSRSQQATRRTATEAGAGPLINVEQRELGTSNRLFTVIDGDGDDQRGVS